MIDTNSNNSNRFLATFTRTGKFRGAVVLFENEVVEGRPESTGARTVNGVALVRITFRRPNGRTRTRTIRWNDYADRFRGVHRV